jgi:hypothetical protein
MREGPPFIAAARFQSPVTSPVRGFLYFADTNNCKRVLKIDSTAQYRLSLLQLSLSFGFSPQPQGWRAFFYQALGAGRVVLELERAISCPTSRGRIEKPKQAVWTGGEFVALIGAVVSAIIALFSLLV